MKEESIQEIIEEEEIEKSDDYEEEEKENKLQSCNSLNKEIKYWNDYFIEILLVPKDWYSTTVNALK